MDTNEGNNLEGLSKHAKDDINLTLERERLTKEIENDLKTNPRYKSFLDKYNSSSVNNFINYYKGIKVSWILYGEMYAGIEEKRILKYSELANERLWDIQYKKLFDMQCQWRAEKIQIPGVKVTHDFWYWQEFITKCPFLTPITEDEFNLYYEHILTDNFEMDPPKYEWMNYDFIIEDFPDWFDFYNVRTGRNFHTLPNIRGEKEEFYIKLYREDLKKINSEKYKANQQIDKRPPMDYYKEEQLEEFINAFESSKLKEYYRVMKNRKELHGDNDDLEEAIEILERAGNIEMEYATTWKESIF